MGKGIGVKKRRFWPEHRKISRFQNDRGDRVRSPRSFSRVTAVTWTNDRGHLYGSPRWF